MKTFSYIPRVTVIPGEFENERIAELVRCCKKYGYDELMFFINGENLFNGFMTIEEIKPFVETIKKAKVELDKIGVKTSLNPWTSLGHGERGRIGISKDRFSKMVGDKGFASRLHACPLDEDFQNYLGEYFAYLAKEIEPNILWVEDDFRLNGHALTKVGNSLDRGCFCDRHMKLYSEYIGREVTREEMINGMATNAEEGVFRRAYYEVSRKMMRDLSIKLGESVHKESPWVKIGLMSGDAKQHGMEGRDWYGMLRGLAGNNSPVSRVHGPMFRPYAPQDYQWYFNDIAMQSRALLPEETIVLPEVENAMFSPQTKSRNMTRFQTECDLALCPMGVTYDMDCFAGSGIVDAFGYGKPLAEIKPYLNAFLNENIDFYALDGVSVPTSEDGFLRSDSKDSLGQVKNFENYWASHLPSWGIAYKYDKSKTFENKVVAISGGYLHGKTDEEIKDLFAKNFLILDGDSVKILFERGLNSLIKAKSYRQISWEKGEFSFEQSAKGKKYLGMNGARAGLIITGPEALAIEYEEGVEIYTELFGFGQEYVAPCFVRAENSLIFPFVISQPAIYSPAVKEKHHALLHTLKEEAFKDGLQNAKGYLSPIIYHDMPCVTTSYYKGEEVDHILLTNFSDDTYEEVQLYGLPKYKKAYYCQRTDGKWKKVKIDGGKIVGKKLDGLTTMLLRLEK